MKDFLIEEKTKTRCDITADMTQLVIIETARFEA